MSALYSVETKLIVLTAAKTLLLYFSDFVTNETITFELTITYPTCSYTYDSILHSYLFLTSASCAFATSNITVSGSLGDTIYNT
jgi:hypothetical protein